MFQAKLNKYRNDAVEYEEQGKELTRQGKVDQEMIKSTQAKMEEQYLHLETQKVSL